MARELDFSETSELNFTHDTNDFLDGLIPNPNEDEIDPKKIEDYLYEDSAEKIYVFLTEKFCHHGFGDYLKRYIYREAKMKGSFNSIPNEEYQNIIICHFRDNLTDFSFYPTKAHSKEVSLNWLKRKVVSRETVLLLGFGLNMSLEDICNLLHKGLHEPLLDPKEPLEATCQYCYRKKYPFPRFKKIWEQFDPDHPSVIISGSSMDSTAKYQEELDSIDNDEDLLAYLYNLPLFKGTKRQSLTARKQFDQLYENIQKNLLKRSQKDEVKEAGLFKEQHDIGSSFSDEQKMDSNAEIENVLYAFVPKTEKMNLAPLQKSTLKDLFYEKRLNRQRIGQIQKGSIPISRFDLITMCFLDYDLRRDNQANIIDEHYQAFIDETNAVLEKCNMEKLYVGNPYECFIMLCMQTESPIEVYSEIWGMSYEEQ